MKSARAVTIIDNHTRFEPILKTTDAYKQTDKLIEPITYALLLGGEWTVILWLNFNHPVESWAVCGSYPDNKNPFDERQAKAWDGPVSAGGWCGQTERQEEANPVEEECHW